MIHACIVINIKQLDICVILPLPTLLRNPKVGIKKQPPYLFPKKKSSEYSISLLNIILYSINMSQMDISIAAAAAAADHSEAESLSDNDINIVDTVVGSLEHNQQLPVLTPRSSNIGYLERCGRWLMAVPRDDVVALQQTSEYREFLQAFDKLGEVCYKLYAL